MRRILWISLFFFILLGCNKPPTGTVVKSKIDKIEDPFYKQYEGYRSGVIQINGAAEVVEEMLEKASELKKKISAPNKKYLDKIIEQIDEARACLADYVEDPLSFEKYKQKPLLKQPIIDAANDAIHELNDIYEIIEESPKKVDFEPIETFTDESIKNLEESITTLGGKIEE